MNEYWEPESLVARLVVGAKVRVRLSSECPFYDRSVKPGEAKTFWDFESHNTCHTKEAAGQVCRIIDTDFPADFGHRFEVDATDWRGHYAAIELEPVEKP